MTVTTSARARNPCTVQKSWLDMQFKRGGQTDVLAEKTLDKDDVWKEQPGSHRGAVCFRVLQTDCCGPASVCNTSDADGHVRYNGSKALVTEEAGMARWQQYIRVANTAPGVLTITIQTSAYPMVGEHWRQQLTGTNRAKWGRIYIDPDPAAKRSRRSIALAPFAGLYKGQAGNNNDECPGAMFIWETQEISNVQPCDAVSNQQFGGDLYRALENAVLKFTTGDARPIKDRMAWWQVDFLFV